MSAWSKLFQNFTWHNKDVARDTPLSAANMQKLNDAIDGVDDRAITLKDGVDSLSGDIGTLSGNVGELQSLIRKTTEGNVSVVNVKYNGAGTSKVKLDGDSILITGVDGTRITDTDSVTLASEDEIVIDIDTGGAYSGKLHFYRNLPSAASLLEDHLAFVIGPQDATKQGVLFKCVRKDVGQQTLYEWKPISLKVSANSDGSYDIPSVVLRSNTLTLVTAGDDEAVLDGSGIEANALYTIEGDSGVTIDAPNGDIEINADGSIGLNTADGSIDLFADDSNGNISITANGDNGININAYNGVEIHSGGSAIAVNDDGIVIAGEVEFQDPIDVEVLAPTSRELELRGSLIINDDLTIGDSKVAPVHMVAVLPQPSVNTMGKLFIVSPTSGSAEPEQYITIYRNDVYEWFKF